MFTKAYHRRNFRIMQVMMLTGIAAGLIFTLLSDGIGDPLPMLNAVISGAMLGLYTAIIEIQLITPRFRRRIRFLPMMVLRIFLYTLTTIFILLLVFSVSRIFWYNLSIQEVWASNEFREVLRKEFLIVVLYAVVVTGIVVFAYQITRKIGPRFMINMISGRYYHPRKSRMIFMFLQVADAERISRELGLLSYYNFFNDIIYDITPPLLAFKGHIYQYVDKEMVFYWHPADGRADAACIRSYFAFCDRLYEYREKYLTRYNTFPVLHTAIHIGDVVQGEIGYGKTEIDFYGDVLNTASRMLNETSPESPLVISSDLRSLLDLPDIYGISPLGEINLRGKSQLVGLYRVQEQALKTLPE